MGETEESGSTEVIGQSIGIYFVYLRESDKPFMNV
jgi:hypothetical protein